MSSPDAARNPATPKGFLFDPNQCTGCQACEVACTIENDLEGMSWRQVSTLNEAHHPGAPVIHLSLACNHCADAPCMEHCPALAYTKDPVSGIVSLDPEHCIGCRYCSWACPYDAPKFDAPNGVMTKCTFCGHRQERGLEPACVELCPTGALGFGDLETLPGDDHAVGLPTTEPGPSIRFMPWKEEAGAACRAADVAEPWEPPATPSKISLRSEWPLLGFTLIGAALVALFAASATGALRLHPLAFLGPAVLSMGLSSLHLGQKLRAWRAILNVRRSWLSREIVLYSGFVGLAALHFLVLPEPVGLARAVALLGFAALFAMDRVYDIVRPAESRYLHSADVLLTGLLVTGLVLGALPVAALVGFLKLALYLSRKYRRRASGKDPRWGWSAGRIVSGFLFPVVMGLLDPERWPVWAIAGTAVGELIDRGEFLTELEVPTPRRQMATDLAKLLGS